MRDEKGRKKEASKVKQTTKQSNTRQLVTFQKKDELPQVESNPRHSTLQTERSPAELPVTQLAQPKSHIS